MEFSSPIQVIGLTYHELLWKWVSDDCNHLRLLVRKIISIYLFSRLLRKSKGAGDARKNVYKQRAWIVLKTQVINREMQLPVGFLFTLVYGVFVASSFVQSIRFIRWFDFILFCSVLYRSVSVHSFEFRDKNHRRSFPVCMCPICAFYAFQ